MRTHHRLIGTSEEDTWRKLLPAGKCVFGSIEFARLQEQHQGRQAKLFMFQHGASRVVYPLLLRPLSELPFVSGATAVKWDSTTPEFTGPFGLERLSAVDFTNAVHRVWSELGVVTEFMHLNPWSEAEQLLPEEAIQYNRDVIWIDTTLSQDELWVQHFSHACRKNLKRAEREGVRVYEASNLDDIREFHRIYRDTMDRNQALSAYYFPLEYFTSIFQTMPQNSRFVMAEHESRIIAATLYLHDEVNMYSYLGGADYEHQAVRPTNAIVCETINWARSRGKKRLVLGGGYQPDDGIFRFKAGFSQLRAAFYTYQQIHLPDQYDVLRDDWHRQQAAASESTPYFPIYRAPVSPERPLLT